MASITKRVAAAIQKEFVEGTVFRVDLDRVDIAPNGSTGILRSLPLTGDRDKVKPGDPVRVINVAGERVALVGDVAFADEIGEAVEDASGIVLEERLSSIPADQKDFTYSLDDLYDVNTTTTPPAANNFLGWDTLSEKWVPKTPAVSTDAATLSGLAPDSGGSASAHVPVTEVDGTLKVASLNVSSGGNFPWMTRAEVNITGGGTVSCNYYSSAYYIKWSARFIVIANGRSSYACPSGYYNIDMPAGGTSIPGYGGSASRTVDATYGIQLGAWEALYYEIPYTSGATSIATNFRVVSYTADFVVPANWILICVCNVDTHATYLFPANGGMVLAPATDCDTKRPTQVGINYVIDGGGSVITAGTKGAIVVPASFLVDNVTLLADVSGAATVNIYYGTYTAYNASMTLFGTYSLASAQKNSVAVGNSLIPADYVVRFDVSGVTSITRLTIAILGFRGR